MSIDVVYTAESTASGGGRDGHVKSSDGRIDFDTRPPKEMGGSGEGVNPELLFSAGYAACFLGALRLVARNEKISIDDASGITAQIGFGKSVGEGGDGGFGLTARLIGYLPGLEQSVADELMEKAHGVCPYSKATRGNIDVELSAKVLSPVRAATIGLVAATLAAAFAVAPAAPADARPSDPGVVSYAVLGKGSVGNIVGAPMTWEMSFTAPFQAFWIDAPQCNNWADIGLPDVYADSDLASFNGAVAQRGPNDDTHLVKQAVGVFATNDAAARAYGRVVDRTSGCAGQTATMHLENFVNEVWTFNGASATPTDAVWVKQEAGIDRRCFIQTRLRENVLLQAKVCQPGNGGPAVNVLAGAMQNSLGQ